MLDWFVKPLLAILLNVCLGLFLADALVSFLDDSVVVFFGSHFLSGARAMVSFLTLMATVLTYIAMGLTPLIPKRLFLPVTLFNPLLVLAVVPVAIYRYGRLPWFFWCGSLLQIVLSLAVVGWLGGLRLRWPLVEEKHLRERRFSWRNLLGFFSVNAFVFLPGAILYFAVLASLAVAHFSDGFVALRSDGIVVRVREYTRDDGRRVRLIPMVHVGEGDFYAKISDSFPSNSVILMEGVTDEHNLLTNKVSYRRMAQSLHLEEQHEKFEPQQGEVVFADVDVSHFSTETIGFLNLVMLFHAQGLHAGNLIQMLTYQPPPGFERRLYEDLLLKRNQRVVEEIAARLPDADSIMVPWGAAHIPGIARDLQKSGFREVESREYQVIRFGTAPNRKPESGQTR